jgi:hypothetical protein
MLLTGQFYLACCRINLGDPDSHAAGAAYALKMEAQENPSDPPRVAAAYFGDGPASEGDTSIALLILPLSENAQSSSSAETIDTPSPPQHLSSIVVTVSIVEVLDMVLIPSESTALTSLLCTKRPKKLDIGLSKAAGARFF